MNQVIKYVKYNRGLPPPIVIEEQLCELFHCLPSELRKEKAEDIEAILEILRNKKE